MIDVKELRISNWIKCGDILCRKIIGIHCSNTNTIVVEGSLTFNYYYPIELTKEILLKAGFKKRESDMVHCGECYYCDPLPKTECRLLIGLNTGAIMISSKTFTRAITLSENVYFLHQLQNLYFALAGEELKVNLSYAREPFSEEVDEVY